MVIEQAGLYFLVVHQPHLRTNFILSASCALQVSLVCFIGARACVAKKRYVCSLWSVRVCVKNKTTGCEWCALKLLMIGVKVPAFET